MVVIWTMAFSLKFPRGSGSWFETCWIMDLPRYPPSLKYQAFVCGSMRTCDVCLTHPSLVVLLPLEQRPEGLDNALYFLGTWIGHFRRCFSSPYHFPCPPISSLAPCLWKFGTCLNRNFPSLLPFRPWNHSPNSQSKLLISESQS